MKLFAVLMLCASGIKAQTNYGGSAQAFALLDRPAGARALAMGSAFEAVADDSSGIYFNPASPALMKNIDLGLHHDAWLAGTARENVSLAAPLGAMAIGVSGSWINYPAIELRDSTGALQGSFNPADEALGLGLAASISPRLALGISARGLREELPGVSYMGVAVGAGLLYAPVRGMRLALVGQGLPQGSGGNSLAPRLSLGAASLMNQVLGGPMTLAISVRMDPSAPAELSLGMEKSFSGFDALALRAGYTAYFPVYSLGGLHGLSLGAGFSLASLKVDYAWLPWGDFGAAQQLSVNWHFLGAKDEMPAVVSQSKVASPNPDLEDGALLMPPALPDAALAPVTSTASTSPQWDYHVLSDGVVKGKALEDVGRPKSAAAAYLEAIKQDPKDIPAWKSLGHLYEQLGKLDWAAKCQEAVKKIESGLPTRP